MVVLNLVVIAEDSRTVNANTMRKQFPDPSIALILVHNLSNVCLYLCDFCLWALVPQIAQATPCPVCLWHLKLVAWTDFWLHHAVPPLHVDSGWNWFIKPVCH